MTGAWAGAGYGWRGSWLVAGRAGFWGALPTWVGVGSSSPQVPGHPTSTCDAGVNTRVEKTEDILYSVYTELSSEIEN